MDLTGTAALAADPERVFVEVADLGTYPSWLGIVEGARPTEPDNVGPAWMVDLGLQLGPIRRTKRVRMARVQHDPPERVRFERLEHDGRTHSTWVLTATVGATESGSLLTVDLHYGGARALPLVDRMLQEEVRRAGVRLDQRLAGAGA
jgi:carbon monoxide dehydrogenase subunit G